MLFLWSFLEDYSYATTSLESGVNRKDVKIGIRSYSVWRFC